MMPRRFLAIVLLLVPNEAVAQLPSFPGAMGAGSAATGGRGGIVYHVTKLDKNFSDNGPGTLRYGLSSANFPANTPRTIVFDVAGTFWLGRYGAEKGHDNGWDTQSRLDWGSNVTIAGQTAPGPVNIMGGVTKASGVNTILRNVTIAPGYGMRNFSKPEDGVYPTNLNDFPDSYTYDAIDISGQGVMIDHVSTLYATDETISANELANNVTIQYSNIAQGQNYPQADAESSATSYTGHALGSLLQAGSNAKITIRDNLYAHLKGRLPRVGSEIGTGPLNDFRNNVFYNWLGTGGTGGTSAQPSFNNFLANFYLAGPGGDDVTQSAGPDGRVGTADDIANVVNANGGTGIFSGNSVTRVYAAGNLKDTNKDGDPNDTSAATYTGGIQTAAYDIDRGVLQTAQAAFNDVLLHMGARWWERDYNYTQNNTAAINTPDERIIHEAATGTGKIMAWADNPFNNNYPGAPLPYDPNEGAEWRSLLALRADPTTGAAPFNRGANWDTDGDGMPNFWEEAHGLNANAANNNGDFDADGYTDVEEYLNDLGAWPAPNPINWTGGNGRFADMSHWVVAGETINTQGVGVITSSTNWQPSRYDSVAIHAGAVTVDAAGQNAGILVVGQNSGDNATLNINNGWIKANASLLIDPNSTAQGTVNLSGGTLFTHVIARGSGGQFNFTGGTLVADMVAFNLVNAGGTIAPAAVADFNPDGVVAVSGPIGLTHVVGDLAMTSGTLAFDLLGTGAGQFDRVVVDGQLAAGGTLAVTLGSGFTPSAGASFDLLDFAGATGAFALSLPTIAPGLVWDSRNLLSTGQLLVAAANADFDGNTLVDGGDFLAWQRHAGATSGASHADGDANGDGAVDGFDLTAWQTQFGGTGAAAPVGAAVPEPAAAVLGLLAVGLVVLIQAQRAGSNTAQGAGLG